MFIQNKDNTITIKCNDGNFRAYALNDSELKNYFETGDFDHANYTEVE